MVSRRSKIIMKCYIGALLTVAYFVFADRQEDTVHSSSDAGYWDFTIFDELKTTDIYFSDDRITWAPTGAGSVWVATSPNFGFSDVTEIRDNQGIVHSLSANDRDYYAIDLSTANALMISQTANGLRIPFGVVLLPTDSAIELSLIGLRMIDVYGAYPRVLYLPAPLHVEWTARSSALTLAQRARLLGTAVSLRDGANITTCKRTQSSRSSRP